MVIVFLFFYFYFYFLAFSSQSSLGHQGIYLSGTVFPRLFNIFEVHLTLCLSVC